jgi:hypothetical protein
MEDGLQKLDTKTFRTIYTIVSIIYLIFMVWGVILALKINKFEQRVLHVTLALIAGPAYVFGYYLSR